MAWLLFDKKGASANTLSAEMLIELDPVLEQMERDRPRGLVIRSRSAPASLPAPTSRNFGALPTPRRSRRC